MIPALDPDPESDFQLCGESRFGFGSSKKRNHKACLYRSIQSFLLRSKTRSQWVMFGLLLLTIIELLDIEAGEAW